MGQHDVVGGDVVLRVDEILGMTAGEPGHFPQGPERRAVARPGRRGRRRRDLESAGRRRTRADPRPLCDTRG